MSIQNYCKKVASTFFILTLGYSNFVQADDTEVYFSDAFTTLAKPNIILLLENSQNMNSKEYELFEGLPKYNHSRFEQAKLLIESILTDMSIKNVRIGVMPAIANHINSVGEYPVVDTDTVDPQGEMKVTDLPNGRVRIAQKKVMTQDFARQLGIAAAYPFNDISLNKALIGLRFNNILIKKPANGEEKDIKAILELYVKKNGYNRTLRISLQNSEWVASSGNYFKPKKTLNTRIFKDTLIGDIDLRISDKLNQPKDQVTCTITAKGLDPSDNTQIKETRHQCDVTELIRPLLTDEDWQDGLPVTFILQKDKASDADISIYDYLNKTSTLFIEAPKKLLAKNKMTTRIAALQNFQFSHRQPAFNFNMRSSMELISQYVSTIPLNTSTWHGPYHYSVEDSPITEDCQPTYVYMMTAGLIQKGYEADVELKRYLGGGQCQILTNPIGTYMDPKDAPKIPDPGVGTADCMRALVSWMARVSHSDKKGIYGNYIYTNTINLSPKQKGNAYLKDVAKYGGGEYYEAYEEDRILNDIRSLPSKTITNTNAKPVGVGTNIVSPYSPYDQRTEIFYNVFQVEPKDYWPGNTKGFQLCFTNKKIASDSKGEQAVLCGWDGNSPALNKKEDSFNNVSTAWSNGIKDSASVYNGGVVGQLPTPTNRNLFTINSNNGTIPTPLNASANLTNAQLDIPKSTLYPDSYRKGLLDFIRGFTYKPNGSNEPQLIKKIGDSANNPVKVLSYGCYSNSTPKKKLLDCDFKDLKAIGYTTSNDGFFRSIDLRTGKTLYEFMPKELLSKIIKLEAGKPLNKDTVKTYGLDGDITVYHADSNRNGSIDNDEKAIAIFNAGRGGAYLYGVDISNPVKPKLLWTITNKTQGFSGLGDTWSTPAIGGVKVENTFKTVAVFGGGYDTTNDTEETIHFNQKGTGIYMIDVETGKLIQHYNKSSLFSVPGAVTLLTDKYSGLISDVIFGDMGGLIWRLRVNNGADANNLLTGVDGSNGVIANLSSLDSKNSRHFYQKPMIYYLDKKRTLSINIGSGYKAHPLSKVTSDFFYSIRVPTNDISKKLIKPEDLATINPKSTTTPNDLTYGFKIKLGDSTGEKVIANAFVAADRVVFNTYTPEVSSKGCVPKVGKRRDYYFDLITGKSLLQTGFLETDTTDLPADVTVYCGDVYCTIIPGIDHLSGEPLPDASFFKKPGPMAAVYRTGWIDLFNPKK